MTAMLGNMDARGTMVSVLTRQLLGPILAFSAATVSWVASAVEAVPISKYFPVCMRPIPGVTSVVHVGIDAAEGQFVGQGGAVDYMISHNPNLPASMGRGVREGRLTEDLQLLAESDGSLQMDANGKPIGYGMERLYGFSNADMVTLIGPVQSKIFVQLWAEDHGHNLRLLKKVADALSRCPNN